LITSVNKTELELQVWSAQD